MKRGDLLLNASGRVVLELRVVLMQSRRGAGCLPVFEVDLLEVLLRERVEGLPGAIGGRTLGHFGFWNKEHRGNYERGNEARHKSLHQKVSIFTSMLISTATGWLLSVDGLNRYWRMASSVPRQGTWALPCRSQSEV